MGCSATYININALCTIQILYKYYIYHIVLCIQRVAEFDRPTQRADSRHKENEKMAYIIGSQTTFSMIKSQK